MMREPARLWQHIAVHQNKVCGPVELGVLRQTVHGALHCRQAGTQDVDLVDALRVHHMPALDRLRVYFLQLCLCCTSSEQLLHGTDVSASPHGRVNMCCSITPCDGMTQASPIIGCAVWTGSGAKRRGLRFMSNCDAVYATGQGLKLTWRRWCGGAQSGPHKPPPAAPPIVALNHQCL